MFDEFERLRTTSNWADWFQKRLKGISPDLTRMASVLDSKGYHDLSDFLDRSLTISFKFG